jgi:hypothetical protein
MAQNEGHVGATIVLSDAEVSLLHELLEGDRCRLLLAIAHTHHRLMKQGLKGRESLLRGMLEKLALEAQARPEARPGVPAAG